MKYLKIFENFVSENLEVDAFRNIAKEIAQKNGMTFMEVDKKLSQKTESNIDLIFGEPSKERLEKLKSSYLIISKYSDTQYYLIMIGDKDVANTKMNNAWSMFGEKWNEFAPGTPNPVEMYGELRHGRGIGFSSYNLATGKPTSQYNQAGYEKQSDDDLKVFMSSHFIDGNAKLNN